MLEAILKNSSPANLAIAETLAQELLLEYDTLSYDELLHKKRLLHQEFTLNNEEPCYFAFLGMNEIVQKNYSKAMGTFINFRSNLEEQTKKTLDDSVFEKLQNDIDEITNNALKPNDDLNDTTFETILQQTFHSVLHRYLYETETHFSTIEGEFFRDLKNIILNNFSGVEYNLTITNILKEYNLQQIQTSLASSSNFLFSQKGHDVETYSQFNGTRNTVFENDMFNFKRIHPSEKTKFETIYNHFSKLPFVIAPTKFEKFAASSGKLGLYLVTPVVGNTLEEELPNLTSSQKERILSTAIKQLVQVQVHGRTFPKSKATSDYYNNHLMNLFKEYGFFGLDFYSSPNAEMFTSIKNLIAPHLSDSFESFYYKDNNIRNIIIDPNECHENNVLYFDGFSNSVDVNSDGVYMIDFENAIAVHPAVDLVNLLEFGSDYLTKKEINNFIFEYTHFLQYETKIKCDETSFRRDYEFARAFRHPALGLYRLRDARKEGITKTEFLKQLSSAHYHFARATEALVNINDFCVSKEDSSNLKDLIEIYGEHFTNIYSDTIKKNIEYTDTIRSSQLLFNEALTHYIHEEDL